ncbi:UNVERIFIED_CONTAM: hypothetical protein RMT77_008078 [Armadillidium vulgare]
MKTSGLCCCLAFMVISVIVTVNGQVGFPGGCPKQVSMQDFNLTLYLGKWYEYSNYFAFYQEGSRCVEALYIEDEDGSIKVTNTQIGLFNQEIKIVGRGTLVDPILKDGRLKVTFFPFSAGAELFGFLNNGNYWVLDTDYDSYSVVWSCTNLGIYNFQNLWILTRNRTPEKSVTDKAEKIVTDRNLDLISLKKTPQDNCS